MRSAADDTHICRTFSFTLSATNTFNQTSWWVEESTIPLVYPPSLPNTLALSSHLQPSTDTHTHTHKFFQTIIPTTRKSIWPSSHS
jgi:uncharacterized membrane protein required for colicin V production